MTDAAATIDDKLAKKIASIIRLFTSDKPGDVDAAGEGLKRTLKSASKDLVYAFAERIEHPGYSEDEVKQIIDGVLIKERQRAAVNGYATPIRPPPSLRAMFDFCRARYAQLPAKDQALIDTLTKAYARGWGPKGEQIEWLKDIYEREGGPS